jgi:hypothetical protein
METRVQVAYHFKIDPAKLIAVTDPERIALPEQITRTVSVGDEFDTEKVAAQSLSPWDRTALREAIAKLIPEATRTAKPIGSPSAPGINVASAGDDEELSAF